MPGLEYAVARARGMRSRLLGRAGLLELMTLRDLGARLAFLRRTDYAADMPATGGLREVSRALGVRPWRDAAALERLLDDRRSRALLRALMAFRDGQTLKTILRGVQHGEPPARLLAWLPPTATLDDRALHALAGARDVKAVVGLLAEWAPPYHAPLLAALPGSQRRHDLMPLEVALDRFLLGRALAAARGQGLADYVRARIDVANAATLVRGGGPELSIAGGRAASDRRLQALVALAADPLRFDRATDRLLMRTLRERARLEPLSMAVPILYLHEREEEVRRIRVVLEGTELGLPADELAPLLEEAA